MSKGSSVIIQDPLKYKFFICHSLFFIDILLILIEKKKCSITLKKPENLFKKIIC